MDTSPTLKTAPRLLVVGLLLLAMLAPLRASTGSSRPAVIAPAVWEATTRGAPADVLILLDEQADLSAARVLSTMERRRYVYDALRNAALRSQAILRTELDDAGVDYRSFYVVNMIALQGGRDLLTQLARRPDVARIVANPSVRQALPQPSLGALRPQASAGVEWNVERVNADDVWELGHAGEGVVVAGQDTGYDWDHPALIEQYRGFNGITATHDYNWHDAIHSPGSDCGADSPVPCDDDGHGTHTMGTIVGDDGGDNHVGVAPEARWIGCRNMDEGVGSPATYIECFQFFLAPYPIGGDPFTDGDPSLAPDVVNNSWTCPPYEGCDPGTLQAAVENVRAAGILVVASAGNSGSGCGSVKDPPAIYDGAFSVGATKSNDGIAGFSSRGPVTVDGSGRRKPDVSAPGVDVRSSVPGASYGLSSGTSMAGPHVAGLAALLWSAVPSLKGDVEATEEIIARAARPRVTSQGCGGDSPDAVPNNVYGWGIVDALAAVGRVWLPIANQPVVLPGFPPSAIRYSLAVTNSTPFSLTGVTVTHPLPEGTRLGWADEGYRLEDGAVSWSVPLLPQGAVLSRTVEVTLDDVDPGSVIANDRCTVVSDQLPGPVTGMATQVVVPWRILLYPIFKNSQMEDL